MTALFRSNSPSKRSNTKASNRTKFPFILMPVTDAGDRVGGAGDSDPVPPSRQFQAPVQLPLEKVSAGKAARRNAVVHQELRSRFPSIASPVNVLEQYSPQEQIRRAARALYPSMNTTTISQTKVRSERNYNIPSTNSEETILFNGLPVSRQRLQAIVMPRLPGRRDRTPTKFRTYTNSSDSSETTPRSVCVSASNSTPQLMSGMGHGTKVSGSDTALCQQELELQLQEKDNEIRTLKQEQAKLKSTLKETALQAQTIKDQQDNLRREFVTLEDHFESLEEKLENQDDLSTMRELLSHTARAQSLLFEPNLRFPTLPQSLDFDRLIFMTHELNSIAGSYQALEIGYTTVGATFKRPNSIVLTLYRNGLTLNDGPFRPYSAMQTTQFIQDIYDGYFPTELQSKYPDGIIILVKDERNTFHPGGFYFPGEGHKLSEQLQQLPKFYPGRKLGAQKREPLLESSSAIKIPAPTRTPVVTYIHLPDLIPNPKPEGPAQRSLYKPTARNRTFVLKLRNIKTGTCYKLKTSGSVTPDQIVLHLEKNLEILSPNADGSYRKFELLNSVPFGLFTLGDTPLRSYGITSNALIYFRPI